MTVAVVGATVILILLTLGYRLNFTNGTIRQGGLVHFISQPSGADVMVDDLRLSNKTRSKITLYPGNYQVRMQREGYQTWQKRVEVKAGAVLWLNSALLIPTQPKTTELYKPTTLVSTAFRADGKYVALLQDATKPQLDVITIDRDTVQKKDTITLPESSYQKAKKHQFALAAWDEDSRWLLVKHQYGSAYEWIVVNTEDPAKVATIAGTTARQVLFDPRSNDSIIVRSSDGLVRTVQLSSGKQSDVLVPNTANMQLGSDNVLTYTTIPTKDQVSLGYLTLGASKGRVIRTWNVPRGQSAQFAQGTYFRNQYIASSSGTEVAIERVTALPASDSDDPLQFEAIKTLSVPQPVEGIRMEGQGRFVAAQHGASLTVYDLELAREYTTPIGDTDSATNKQSSPLKWLDPFHFWDTSTGFLRQYEFDGTNQVSVVAVKKGSEAGYSSNYEYLYTIGADNQLQATALRVK